MRRRNRAAWGWWAGLALAAVAAGLGLRPAPASAQDTGWSPPQLIYEGLGKLDWPKVIADPYGQVHALWAYGPENANAQSKMQLYYTRLDQPNLQPIDVMVYPGPLTSMNAGPFGDGLFVTMNGQNYGLTNGLPEPSARGWEGPFGLPGFYLQPGMAQDTDGSMWLGYSARADNGVYVKRLDIETASWDDPLPVSYPINPNTAPDWVRLAVGPDGWLHVVWTEYQLPEGWPPKGLYYSESADKGATWTTPRQIAPGDFNQPNIGIGPDQSIYVTYLGIAGRGGRYFMESLDNGRTWQEPVTLSPPGGVGTAGSVQIAVDSLGQVHTVYLDQGCVYHHMRLATGWAERECVSGDDTRTLKEYPSMTISQGNQIYVLFYTERKQIWFTTKTLDAPQIPALPLPTPVPPTPTVLAPTATVEPTPTYLPDYGPPPELGAVTRVSVLSIVAGVAPVMIFFGGLLFVRSLRRK